ncbi:MAG: toxin-antitoxin system HicB family antitoxin [Azoarcus sp.]|jgi:predicted transcriptional regulator|nr:toxin-antitoxin system HicB family antitoxin [Azoarcus sp.]
MSTMTIRLPDDIANRLKNVAQAQKISVNKLMTAISVQTLAAFDAETRFKVMAAEADVPAALAVLDRLDRETAAQAEP